MRIAAHIGVKDEVELLDRVLRHLASIGIDQVIATDMGSTDGSLQLLEQEQAQGPLKLLQMNDRDPEVLHEWAPRVTALARSAGADWTVFLDADELLLPATGSLRDCASLGNADVLLIDRFNVPLAADGPLLPSSWQASNYSSVELIVGPIANFSAHLAQFPDTPWIRGVPLPKAMVRTERMAQVTVGGHDVIATPGAELRRVRAADMVIAHLPFTCAARFTAKVENVRATIGANSTFFRNGVAWHWRRWMEQLQAGSLDEEFARQVFSASQLAALRDEGVVCNAEQWFRQRMAGMAA